MPRDHKNTLKESLFWNQNLDVILHDFESNLFPFI